MKLEELLGLGPDIKKYSDEELHNYLARYFPQTRPEGQQIVDDIVDGADELPDFLKQAAAAHRAKKDGEFEL